MAELKRLNYYVVKSELGKQMTDTRKVAKERIKIFNFIIRHRDVNTSKEDVYTCNWNLHRRKPK